MKKLALVLAAVVVSGSIARAQSRVITIQPADVDAVVSGALIVFLPDGGCTAQALLSIGNVNGVDVQTQPHPFNGARCVVAQNAAQRAAELDTAVGDGGAP